MTLDEILEGETPTACPSCRARTCASCSGCTRACSSGSSATRPTGRRPTTTCAPRTSGSTSRSASWPAPTRPSARTSRSPSRSSTRCCRRTTRRCSRGFEFSVYHKQMTEVGGDYYDFYRLRDGSHAIGVFDISGHGVSAALIMAYLKAQLVQTMEQVVAPARHRRVPQQRDRRVPPRGPPLRHRQLRRVRRAHVPLRVRRRLRGAGPRRRGPHVQQGRPVHRPAPPRVQRVRAALRDR